MLNQNLLNENIAYSKKLIAGLFNKKDYNSPLFAKIHNLNKEVCMVVADFKCEKCKSEENLTLHHLIPRKAKEFTDFWRYASQRFYWGNCIILCTSCHKDYHNFNKSKDNDMNVIVKEKIEWWKKKYDTTIVW
jgi:5-methylcytosine-specific restriction endonuclease McrA